MDFLKAFAQSLPLAILVMAALAAVAIMAVFGPLDPGQAFGFVMFIITGTAVAGTVVLTGPKANSALAPHLLVVLAILAYATCLGVQKVFTGAEVTGIFTAVLGAGTFGGGVAVQQAATAASGGGGGASVGQSGSGAAPGAGVPIASPPAEAPAMLKD